MNDKAVVSREMSISTSHVVNTTDIVFVFDTSGSMNNTDKDAAIAAAKDFANTLLVTNPNTVGNVRIGLAKFATLSSQMVPLTDNYTLISNALPINSALSPVITSYSIHYTKLYDLNLILSRD